MVIICDPDSTICYKLVRSNLDTVLRRFGVVAISARLWGHLAGSERQGGRSKDTAGDTGSLAWVVALDNPREEGWLAAAAYDLALKEEALERQAVDWRVVDGRAERG